MGDLDDGRPAALVSGVSAADGLGGGGFDLLAWSDRYWEDEALPVLAEYTRIPCLSPEFDTEWESTWEIHRAAELLRDWAAARPISGLSVDLVQLPGLTPVILAEVPATRPTSEDDPAETPPTLLYGHLDKQPPLGTWRSGLAPFEPVREGDHFYGRGTADDGYSIFAALGAIELAQQPGNGHGRCVVIIEASEESGSPHLGAYLGVLRDRLGAAGPGLVVCLDSGAQTYDRLWTTTSLRGLVAANLRVDVLREGIHSGTGGALVPSSFRILRQLLSRIEDETTGALLLDACDVTVPALREQEAQALVEALGEGAIGALPTVPGLRLANGASAVGQVLARSWRAALAVTGVDGMPAIADAGNVLRPFTAVKLALRIPPSADATEVADELTRRLLAEPPEGATVTVSDVVAADGFDAPATAAWLAEAADDASSAFFGAPSGAMGEGGTIPFLSELRSTYREAQFLVTGVLGPGSNAHGPNEMLHLPTAKALTASVAHVLGEAAGS